MYLQVKGNLKNTRRRKIQQLSYWLLIIGEPIRIPSGKEKVINCYFTDITKQKHNNIKIWMSPTSWQRHINGGYQAVFLWKE